MLLKLVPLDF